MNVWGFRYNQGNLRANFRVTLTDRRICVQGIGVQSTGLFAKAGKNPKLNGSWFVKLNRGLEGVAPPQILSTPTHPVVLMGGIHAVLFHPAQMTTARAMVDQIILQRNLHVASLHRSAATQSHSGTGPTVIKETIREVVKVPCGYCGTLNVITGLRCDSCGAPIR